MRIDDIVLKSGSYRADYQAMRQMIYGDYPSFDELLETLKELEADVNAIAGLGVEVLSRGEGKVL